MSFGDICAVVFFVFFCGTLYLAYKAVTFKKTYNQILERLDSLSDPTEEERDLFWQYFYCIRELKNPYIPLLVNGIMISMATYLFPTGNDTAGYLLIWEVVIIFPITSIMTAYFCKKNIATRHKYNIYDKGADLADLGGIAANTHGLYSWGKKLSGSSKRKNHKF